MDIQTSCRNCGFARYEGKTQTDCALGRIEKYRGKGVEVVEAYDEEKEFFLIKDRICRYCRPPEWVDKNAGKDLVRVATEENSLRLEIVIPVSGESKEEVFITLSSIDGQTKPPYLVNLALDAGELSASDFVLSLRDKAYGWNIYTSQEPSSKEVLVHRAVEHSKSNYLLVVPAGIPLKTDVVERIARVVDEDEKRFVYLDSVLRIELIQTGAFKHMGGNLPMDVAGPETTEHLANFREKIAFAVRTQGHSELVGRLEYFI